MEIFFVLLVFHFLLDERKITEESEPKFSFQNVISKGV